MSTALESLRALLQANPSTDIILISHEINRKLYYKLSKELNKRKTASTKCLVFLSTHGGDPHAGFRIARCLRHHYEKVRLVVPHLCKSAGTLIAIGADEIAIGNLGELGPLDVQISKRTEMLERSSGLDFTEALSAMLEHAQTAFRASLIDLRAGAGISTKMAGEFSSQLAIGMVAPMYAQIDPIQVGEVHRAMKIAFEYGTRLDDDSDQLKPEALIQLVSAYPDHSFVIDRKEAKKLFRSVSSPTVEEDKLASDLWNTFFRTESDQCAVFDADTVNQTGDDDDENAVDEEVVDEDDAKGDLPRGEVATGAQVDGTVATKANGSIAGTHEGTHAG